MIEKIIFPPQIFVSAGMIVENQKCSICHKEYSDADCDHIKGKIYMGKICKFIIEKATLEHIAMVTNPAYKTCRVIQSGYGENYCNIMTLKPLPKPS